MIDEQPAARPLDALIIGAGPAGLAVARETTARGLSTLVFEKGPVGAHIAEYPTFMRFFSTSRMVELADFPLTTAEEKPTRAEYLAYLAAFVRHYKLPVETYAEALSVAPRAGGGFEVAVRRWGREAETLRARAVVVAVGAWERTRRLGAEGEDLPKVHRRFTEAHRYIGRKVLVVGGANSAVETALHLHRSGAEVALAHRGANFHNRTIKYWLRPDLDNRIARGEIAAHPDSVVERIDPGTVTLRRGDGSRKTIENDFVLPMIGYDPPVGLLRSFGINIDPHTSIPEHDPETFETNVPGLYIAGVIAAGNIGGRIFIENLRAHGAPIAEALAGRIG